MANDGTQHTGRVVRYDPNRFWGFVKDDADGDEHLIRNAQTDRTIWSSDKKLFQGALVAFVLETTTKGYLAKPWAFADELRGGRTVGTARTVANPRKHVMRRG